MKECHTLRCGPLHAHVARSLHLQMNRTRYHIKLHLQTTFIFFIYPFTTYCLKARMAVPSVECAVTIFKQ